MAKQNSVTTMKAVIFKTYGPPEVLQLTTLLKPKPKPAEVLVKVRSVAATAADARIRGARFPQGFGFLAKLAFGLFKPRNQVLGNSFSGVVEAVGDAADGFKPGDAVSGMTGIKMGAYAEYLTVRADKSVALKPQSVSHDEAAAMLFGGTTALYFLRDKAGVTKGQTVLVNGASGAVGSNAIQIARHFGATVTAVTSSKNEKLVRSLGATDVIDYEKQNVADTNKKFDLVIDMVGNITVAQGKQILTDNGTFIIGVGTLADLFNRDPQVISASAPEKKEAVESLLSLMEQKKLKAVIEKTYPLEEAALAHERIDSGHKVGNIILNP